MKVWWCARFWTRPMLAPADGFILQGDAENDQLGISFSGAGDVNGDGLGRPHHWSLRG